MVPKVCSVTLYAWRVIGNFEDEICTIEYVFIVKIETKGLITELIFSIAFNYLSAGTFQK